MPQRRISNGSAPLGAGPASTPMVNTEPTIGWFMWSEGDRDAAGRSLAKLSTDGTRDELGFAPIHVAFADRFFPGTAVQHAPAVSFPLSAGLSGAGGFHRR